MPEMRIYPLTGISEEVAAVAFAKTSRSPEPFDKIAAELSAESSSKFHEKWVVGYGHSSVAEHAVAHLAAEDISRLAVECIESNRLGSYTEKSTRYQQLDKSHTHLPEEIKGTPLQRGYEDALSSLFTTYGRSISALVDFYSSSSKPEPGKEKAHEIKLKTMAMDSARFLLPNSTLANVGITMNARVLEYALIKMLSSPLAEVRKAGTMLRSAGAQVFPTLLRRAEENPALVDFQNETHKQFHQFSSPVGSRRVHLIHYDKNALESLSASILYRWSGLSFEDALAHIKSSKPSSAMELFKSISSRFPEGLKPIRELEHITYTFDLLMDQGAYYEFKRHRMMTISAQEPTISLGYRVPEDIEKCGMKKEFAEAMKESAECFQRIEATHPFAAGYIATNAHYRRVLATMNLRELATFIRLRSAPFAHFTIRELASEMLEELRKVHPEFAEFIKPGA
ncbi:MAG: FAD-dependent thymidylate synthase [Candidatus Micrarchaeia archaeon]|jgi:thymidylate synthase ThyX